MLRSFWFWLLILIVAAGVIWFARDRISAYIPESSFSPSTRTTDTQKLALTVSPNAGKHVSSGVLQASDSIDVSRVLKTTDSSRDAATPRPTTQTGADAKAEPTQRPTRTPKQTATIKSASTYTVKVGDTLYSIAKKHGMDVEALMRLNGISDPQTLQVGAELQVKTVVVAQATAVKTAPAGSQAYKVRAGDTLSSIARAYKATASDLQRLNHLANPNDLTVGMTLFVPKQSGATTGANGTRGPNGGQIDKPQPSPTPNPATPTPGPPRSTITPAVAAAALAVESPSTTAPTASTAPTAVVVQAPLATATFTPVPHTVCPGGERIALVWGVGFCLPDGWSMYEQGPPNRGIFAVASEANGDRAVFGVIRPEGWPNAPLSWAMRSAKNSIQEQAGNLIPGGVSSPQTWTVTQPAHIAGVSAQMAETMTTYASSGNPARLRLLVFNHQGQRWWVMMMAPQNRWRYYVEAGFPAIANTLNIF